MGKRVRAWARARPFSYCLLVITFLRATRLAPGFRLLDPYPENPVDANALFVKFPARLTDLGLRSIGFFYGISD
jgi:hypothetical protein